MFLIWTGFLESESHLTKLSDTLNLVPAPDLRNLVKELHISLKPSTKKGQTKEVLVEAMIHHTENQRSLFGNSANIILKRYRS